MNLITRTDAKASGLTRYFTGKACSLGHVCERYVSNFSCVICNCRGLNKGDLKGQRDRYRERMKKARRALAALEELGIDI